MYTSTLAVALLAALPSAVNAAGSAVVKNNCDYPVNLWSVATGDWSPPMQTVESGGEWSEAYQTPPTGGISIKIARGNDLYAEDLNPTQFEYTMSKFHGMIFYDISNINGFPFAQGGLALTPSDSSCPAKICHAGKTICDQAYNTPDENENTASCSQAADTVMTLCSGNSQSHPHSHAHAEEHAAPAPAPVKAAYVAAAPAAPAPVVTAAPAVTAEAIPEPNGQIWTTFVTQVVTVEAKRDAMPTQVAEPVKRDDMHAQMHARSAHRHHFHRHEADAE